MILTDFAKLLLMQAACTNALAVCGNAAGDDGKLAVDPEIADNELRGKGLMVYEEAKIQYHALLRAFNDKSGIWPDPKIEGLDLIGKLPGLLKLLPADLLGKAGPLLSLLGVGQSAPALSAESPKTPGL